MAKIIELWDEDQGWRQYCDICGARPDRCYKLEELPTTCNNCAAELTEIERC